MKDGHWILILVLFLLQVLNLQAQPLDYPTATLSSVWTNGPNVSHAVIFSDGSMVKSILLRRSPSGFGPTFACGFYCGGGQMTCDAFLFAVFIVYANSSGGITLTGIPQVVWSANRDRLVKENATLSLTADGDLVLKDADDTRVWSTNTSRYPVVGMSVTEGGNLVLLDEKNATVWQSFDHPTDALVPGQKLMEGQKLIASLSATNWSRGELYLSVASDGLKAFVGSDPPQLYKSLGISEANKENISFARTATDSTVYFFLNSSDPSRQYMRLEYDGHLRIYAWADSGTGWKRGADVFSFSLGECAFPTVCGHYGVCSKGQCSCPQDENNTKYFRQIDKIQPNLGCQPLTFLNCQSLESHRFVSLESISYFGYNENTFLYSNASTPESCKESCLKNCSCKAAMLQYFGNVSHGRCYLPTQIFSLVNNQPHLSHYNSTVYIKVQIPSASSANPNTYKWAKISLAVGGFALGVVIILVAWWIKRRYGQEQEEEDDDFIQLPGMPSRFSLEELRIATNNYCQKLGQGGFGSVFEGTLVDGIKVAVKMLDSVHPGKRDFLAEVETIGNVHHFNLVRLVGFCAEKSQRLLVYEYMSNGSLEKWIFHCEECHVLDWGKRKKIINHVAKGLQYLHEECRQKILHLDIKPQNILLDEDFNAKVSDFGLSKLIDRDQSTVMTTLRGTPGYLAPEWLTSMITEKVDVYSFGVLVVEIVCGRKNLDHSQPEGSFHLLSILKDKAVEDNLLDIIDKHCPSIHENEEEAVDMLKLAIWCLQNDTAKRPFMSTVVKVLEGAMEIPNIDFNFMPSTSKAELKAIGINISAPQLASVISGPR